MINIAFFDGVRSTEPANMELSWDNLCNLMQEASHEPWKRADKLGRMAFVAGAVQGQRSRQAVKLVSFGSFDIDLAPSDPNYRSFAAMQEALEELGLAYILATSTKSTAKHNRYRLILRFDEAVPADDYHAAWSGLSAAFGGVFDPSTHDPSRLSILPARWTGAPIGSDGKAIADWVEIDAFHSFAFCAGGVAIPTKEAFEAGRSIVKIAPQATRSYSTETISSNLTTEAEALVRYWADRAPPAGSVGFGLAVPPTNEIYCSADFGITEGGRMYRYLSRVASSAFARKIPINRDILFELASRINDANGAKHRPDLMREVDRALASAATFITETRSARRTDRG